MIDGKDFITFLSGFLAFIKKVILYVLTSIRDYFKVFIATLIIILSIGLWYWHSTKVFFEAEMACNFKDQTKKTYGEMIHNLDILVKDHSYDALAGVLHLSALQVQSIISIEGKNMLGSMLYEDITPAREPFYIDVKASDNAAFTALQPALLMYLNTASPYALATRRQDSSDIYTKIQSLENNIALTDTTIAAYDTMLTKNADTSIPATRFTALLTYKSSLDSELSEQKKKGEKFSMSVEALHGFMPLDNPSHERDKNLKLTITAAILLAGFSSILSRTIHDIKVANKNRSTTV